MGNSNKPETLQEPENVVATGAFEAFWVAGALLDCRGGLKECRGLNN